MKKFQLKKDNQIFSRFEFKYIINKKISESLKVKLSNLCSKIILQNIMIII